MAEALVFLVIKQMGFSLASETIKALGSLSQKERSFLIETESKITQIQSEFEVMQAFLVHTARFQCNNEPLKAWLNQVRDTAFEVEDVIDEYVHFIGEQKNSGFTGFLKTCFQKSKNIVVWHDIATKLAEIQAQLQNLSNIKNRYSINMSEEGSASVYASENQNLLTPYLMDQYDPVGIDEEREKMVGWLTNGKSTRSIISVWGMGGLGKTTLVRNVYRSQIIKKHFDCQAWVSVSQKYQVRDVLRALLDAISINEAISTNFDSTDHHLLMEIMQEKLQERRYLIVLDDVWSSEAWFGLAGAVVDNDLGSRVVITTRSKDVAMLANHGFDLKLQSLRDDAAWDLFCRKAFTKEEGKACPQALVEWARKIVEECHGLPLAIVAIGSLLSYKIREEEEWRKFFVQLNWESSKSVELNWVARVLNLSYTNLPSYLKNCFLYCSIFPEDHNIRRKRLIRLWIAEGFIETRAAQTLEEVAEGYLNELVHRCMLQVVKWNEFGRVKLCQMHDLVRELTVTTAKEENFCTVLDDQDSMGLHNRPRRLSIHDFNNNLHPTIALSHVRTLIMFDTVHLPLAFSIGTFISSCKYLRVLELRNMPIKELPNEVMDLFSLRYLGLRSTNVKKLPGNIGRLRHLQTLDLYHTKVERLPRGITKLTSLRHLFVEINRDRTGVILNRGSGVVAPRGLWNLSGLHTLQAVEASESLVRHLGNLSQLRSLRIWKVRHDYCAELCASLAKMHFLSTLYMTALDENEVLQLDGLNPPPKHLYNLSLRGKLQEGILRSPQFQTLGINLRKLSLCYCGVQENPLPFLSHMTRLSTLFLNRFYVGQKLRFCSGWFPKLKLLDIRNMPELDELVFEEGAMTSLDRLNLLSLNELKEVPQGIEFLLNLQELWLGQMHEELNRRIKGEDRAKVTHITKINLGHQRDGRWLFTTLR